ncbi:MAG: hypothetical protein ACJATT_002903 [Myxococcota bacterium]|jgi:hypothetical protein
MVDGQDGSAGAAAPLMDVPGATLTIEPRHEGWIVSASWLSSPVWVAAADSPPALHWRLSSGEVVLHLVVPLSLAPGEIRTLSLRWPLELKVEGVAESYRPRLRQTLLGPVDGGRILPSIVADAVGEGAKVEPYEALLHVVVRNASPRPVLVRRMPIQEAELTLAELDGRLHCGTVDVTLFDETQASAKMTPLSLKPDRVLYSPIASNRTHGLRWLVDATRRSTAYQQ